MFENIIKIMTAYVVPAFSTVTGLTLYFTGMKPKAYYVLHGMGTIEDETSAKIAALQIITALLLFTGFFLSRLWISKPNWHSNHIISSKAVGLFCIDMAIYLSMTLIMPQIPAHFGIIVTDVVLFKSCELCHYPLLLSFLPRGVCRTKVRC